MFKLVAAVAHDLCMVETVKALGEMAADRREKKKLEDYDAMEAGYLPSSDFLIEDLAQYFDCNPWELIYGGGFFAGDCLYMDADVLLGGKVKDDTLIKAVHDLKNDAMAIGDAVQFVVNEDSMSPTIDKGDKVQIEKQIPVFFEGFYLFDFGGNYGIRRPLLQAEAKLTLKCDNSDYNDNVTVDLSQALGMVLGKVTLIMKCC